MTDEKFRRRVMEMWNGTKLDRNVWVSYSAAAIGALEEITRGEERAARDYVKVAHIDYALDEPMTPVIDGTDGLDEGGIQSFCSGEGKAVREGHHLYEVLALLEDLYKRVFVFFDNCQRMDVEQAKSLSSFSVMVSDRILSNTTAFIPVGDWKHRIEYLGGDGCSNPNAYLGYGMARWVLLQPKSFDKNGVEAEAKACSEQLKEQGSLNVYGPNLSGKTNALSIIHSLVNLYGTREYVTVYPGLSERDMMMREIRQREIPQDRLLILDGAHMLQGDVLSSIREQYPRIAVSSLERLPGFDLHLDTSQFV